MSHRALVAVDRSRAFDATRRFEELAFFHVPFDELNGDQSTETFFTHQVANEGRVAVIGSSGAGKSSLISSVLGPFALDLPERIVPLRVPVAAETDETVTEPGAMARHLVRYVTRWASPELFSPAEKDDFARSIAEVTRRAGTQKVRAFRISLPLWLADAEFAAQVQALGSSYESRGSSTDALEHLKRLVALFDHHGLFPVFVFDDSDTWLRIPGLDRTGVANQFFMRTIRMLAKEVSAGLVVAVHEHYLDLAGYREASAWFTGEVRIPRLIDARAGIEAILRDRLVVAGVEAPIGDVIDAAGIDQLAKFYESGRNLRDVLRVMHRSLQHALSDGVDLITESLVESVVTELSAGA
ncbi:MAG: hypothetical protein DIU67_007925 [Actinomycetes bacterium]|jgi:hypothetical protein|nr:MAG: hypothetical protein DIU67_05030 [Actinomycetota bacterium]